MTCDFTSFSTIFRSYLDDERVIIEGSVQWNPVNDGRHFRFLQSNLMSLDQQANA